MLWFTCKTMASISVSIDLPNYTSGDFRIENNPRNGRRGLYEEACLEKSSEGQSFNFYDSWRRLRSTILRVRASEPAGAFRGTQKNTFRDGGPTSQYLPKTLLGGEKFSIRFDCRGARRVRYRGMSDDQQSL